MVTPDVREVWRGMPRQQRVTQLTHPGRPVLRPGGDRQGQAGRAEDPTAVQAVLADALAAEGLGAFVALRHVLVPLPSYFLQYF